MQNADIDRSPVVSHPHDAGSTPQRAPRTGRARYAFGVVFGAALSLAACESSTDATGVIPPVVLGMSSTAAPYYTSANLTIYWEQVPVSLPVRKGTGKEANVSPYPSSPYLLASDYLLQVNYTVTNLDKTAHNVWVTLDPWNQFVRYYPRHHRRK